MGLSKIQLPDLTRFVRHLNNSADQMDQGMQKIKSQAEFLARMSADDLVAIGLTDVAGASEVEEVDMSHYRTAVDELTRFYYGEALTATRPIHEVFDKIRSM